MRERIDRTYRFPEKYYWTVAGIFAAIGVFLSYLYAEVWPWESRVILRNDTMGGVGQGMKMLADHIVRGQNLYYSWETSMGQNTSLIYAAGAYNPFIFFYMIIPDI